MNQMKELQEKVSHFSLQTTEATQARNLEVNLQEGMNINDGMNVPLMRSSSFSHRKNKPRERHAKRTKIGMKKRVPCEERMNDDDRN